MLCSFCIKDHETDLKESTWSISSRSSAPLLALHLLHLHPILRWCWSAMIVIITVFISVWFVSLLFLTLDQVAKGDHECFLRSIWVRTKDQNNRNNNWFIGMIEEIIVSICVFYKRFNNERIWYVYICPIYHNLFIIVSTTTYVSIYRKFYASRKNLRRYTNASRIVRQLMRQRWRFRLVLSGERS